MPSEIARKTTPIPASIKPLGTRNGVGGMATGLLAIDVITTPTPLTATSDKVTLSQSWARDRYAIIAGVAKATATRSRRNTSHRSSEPSGFRNELGPS